MTANLYARIPSLLEGEILVYADEQSIIDDQSIIDELDRELASLGLVLVESEDGDLVAVSRR